MRKCQILGGISSVLGRRGGGGNWGEWGELLEKQFYPRDGSRSERDLGGLNTFRQQLLCRKDPQIMQK